jgi:hypothetical protein
MFQLWCSATRFKFSNSSPDARMKDEDLEFNKAMENLADTLISHHESQTLLKITPKILEKSKLVFPISQKTSEHLLSYGFPPETIEEDERFICLMYEASKQPYDHYKSFKENKPFRKWAQQRAPLLKIYDETMSYGKRFSQEIRHLTSYDKSIKTIQKKLGKVSILSSQDPEVAANNKNKK